jgi:hypothetical protein
MFGLKRRNPTSDWAERPEVALTVDLDTRMLCGIVVGDRANALGFLGPGVPGSLREFEYPGRGVTLAIDGDVLKAFHVHYPAFRGAVRHKGTVVWTESIIGMDAWTAFLGEPDVVEDEILTYLNDGREWEVILESGRLKTISVY